MRPPSQRLAPRDRNHQAARPRPSGGSARGPGGDSGEPCPPPPLPPPGPLAAGGRPERRRPRTPLGGPLHPGRDATVAVSAAAHQAPPVDRPLTPALPAAGWRLCAGAVGCNRTAAPGNVQTKQTASVPAWGKRGSRPWRQDLSPPTPPH